MRTVVPSWLVESLPDQADDLQKAAVTATTKQTIACLEALGNGQKLVLECLNKADLDSAEIVAREILESARLLVDALSVMPTGDTRTKDSAAPVKSWTDRSYDRCWYYVMARRPADLSHLTYKHIKSDPRIVALWAEAKALDADGKLTSSGKLK